MLIEQAVYTSAKSVSGERYRLAAQSPGVTAADARELCAWGPGEGALREGSGGSSSVNFHPLPSGASCVGYSMAVDNDRSDCPGYRAYTQSLIVPAEELARFANNPFALLRAARGLGVLKIHDILPTCLEPIQLPGQSAAVDEGLLGELFDRWGPRHLAWLVQAALTADALVVVGTDKADWLVAGLMNCLPVECRPESVIRNRIGLFAAQAVSPERRRRRRGRMPPRGTTDGRDAAELERRAASRFRASRLGLLCGVGGPGRSSDRLRGRVEPASTGFAHLRFVLVGHAIARAASVRLKCTTRQFRIGPRKRSSKRSPPLCRPTPIFPIQGRD